MQRVGAALVSRNLTATVASGVEVEYLVDHLPSAIELEQIEEAGEAVASPVVLVKATWVPVLSDEYQMHQDAPHARAQRNGSHGPER